MSHYVLKKYRSNIKNHELEEFKNKLRAISEHLDTIIIRLEVYNYETAYISGGCAAWLIKRINEFDDIDIYVFSSTLDEDKTKIGFYGLRKIWIKLWTRQQQLCCLQKTSEHDC